MEKRIDKATERALEAYPKETRDITGFVVDIGHPQYMRDLYIEGYHQAEKDLALTWEDMRELYIIFAEVDTEIELCKTDIKAETIGYYEEVLKRFKNLKK
jgi:hypothetical protein